MIPANVGGNHWIAIAIDFQEHTITCYDSKRGRRHQELLEVTLRYLADEHRERVNTTIDYSLWRLVHYDEAPTQDNDDDCGVFTCYVMEYLTQGRAFDFGAAHSHHLRYRMTLALIQGALTMD